MWILPVIGCTSAPVVLLEPIGVDPGQTACPQTGTCVDDPVDDDVRNGWVNVALDPGGGAWVVWAQADGAAVTDLFLARSPAPGAPLSAPIAIPVAEPPNVGVTEKPTLAVDGERLVLAYTGKGPYRHGDAGALYLQTGTWAADEVRFDAAQVLDLVDLARDPADLVLEQARVALSPAGEAFVVWKRQIYGVEDHVFVAREGEGFAPAPLSEALPTEHDCSPPDVRFGFSGQLLVGVRGNIDGWLQTLAVVADPDAGEARVVQVSDDRWPYDPAICPEDGPRLVELADGTVFTAWMAPVEGTWRLVSAWSTDGGATFGAATVDDEDVGLGQTWVAVAPTAEGPFHVAVEGLDRQTQLITRDTPEGPRTERWLTAPDGAAVVDVEIASAHGRSVAVGITEDRVLWLIDL